MISSQVYSSTTASAPSPVFDTAHAVVDDSSLAALTTPDGNRHVFFQDNRGMIRQAIYVQSTKSWTARINYVVAMDARNLTPISAGFGGNSHHGHREVRPFDSIILG